MSYITIIALLLHLDRERKLPIIAGGGGRAKAVEEEVSFWETPPPTWRHVPTVARFQLQLRLWTVRGCQLRFPRRATPGLEPCSKLIQQSAFSELITRGLAILGKSWFNWIESQVMVFFSFNIKKDIWWMNIFLF